MRKYTNVVKIIWFWQLGENIERCMIVIEIIMVTIAISNTMNNHRSTQNLKFYYIYHGFDQLMIIQ